MAAGFEVVKPPTSGGGGYDAPSFSDAGRGGGGDPTEGGGWNGGGGGWQGGGQLGGGGGIMDGPSWFSPSRPRRFSSGGGGGYGMGPGFDYNAFDPFNPGASAPGLAGSFPTLDMLKYLSGTALQDRQDRYQQAMNAAQFAMQASAQPINAFDWWRLLYGKPRANGEGGPPLPSFIGTNGQTSEKFNFPQVAVAGETFTNPSGQMFNQLSPNAQQGLIGYYRSLGVPVEDLMAAIQRPTEGLGGAAPVVRKPLNF